MHQARQRGLLKTQEIEQAHLEKSRDCKIQKRLTERTRALADALDEANDIGPSRSFDLRSRIDQLWGEPLWLDSLGRETHEVDQTELDDLASLGLLVLLTFFPETLKHPYRLLGSSDCASNGSGGERCTEKTFDAPEGD